MNEMVEINLQTVGGPLRAKRNMFRFPGDPLSVKVIDGENEHILVRIPEQEFDERDVTFMGVPDQYCVLAPGLAALWPTPGNAMLLEIRTEVP